MYFRAGKAAAEFLTLMNIEVCSLSVCGYAPIRACTAKMAGKIPPCLSFQIFEQEIDSDLPQYMLTPSSKRTYNDSSLPYLQEKGAGAIETTGILIGAGAVSVVGHTALYGLGTLQILTSGK
ncbi:hypothetical protein EBB07_33645 [Paenibacillaceae bacterium]|nr:hypothetical protein EBB07_33645 [Paenibacillaceae bacterium]